MAQAEPPAQPTAGPRAGSSTGRTWAIFAAGLALGLGGAWFLLSGRGGPPMQRADEPAAPPVSAVAPRAAPVAAAPASASTTAAAATPVANAECGDALLLAKSDARDGDVALLEAASTPPDKDGVQDFILQGKEAVAGGRRRDAEANFINACRLAAQLPGDAAELRADAMYRLGRLYAHAAPDAPGRPRLAQRAAALYTAALQTYRAQLGEQAEKTRFAAAGLAALGGVQVAQAVPRPAEPPPAPAVRPRPQTVPKAAPAAEPVEPAPAAEPVKPPPAPKPVKPAPAPEPQARQAPARPSFDCALARSTPEKLICADAELARADRELGTLHARAKAAAPDRRAFQRESDAQWRWREQNCRDRACLRQWYADRREQLASR